MGDRLGWMTEPFDVRVTGYDIIKYFEDEVAQYTCEVKIVGRDLEPMAWVAACGVIKGGSVDDALEAVEDIAYKCVEFLTADCDLKFIIIGQSPGNFVAIKSARDCLEKYKEWKKKHDRQHGFDQ